MLRVLLMEVRAVATGCRDRWLDFWYYGDRLVLAVVAVPALAAAVFAGFAHFAFDEQQRMRAERERHAALRCLAENVYYEGRGEPLNGQRAVAEVTLNRVASPRFPDSVCAVVHEKRLDPKRGRYVGAFSWTELEVQAPSGPAWQRAMKTAVSVYDGRVPPLVPEALYYHAARVRPRWARSKRSLARIGNHVFYR